MSKAAVDLGPKRKDDDCDMVTSQQITELSKNEMCLHEAARLDKTALLRKIIRRNAANINCKNNIDRTALHLAAAQGHKESTEILVREGKASLDLPDKYGMTPCLWAAYFGHVEVVEFLVQRGANITKKNKHGSDIVHIACLGNRTEILQYIFRAQKSLKIDEPDNDGMTPLLLAISKNNFECAKAISERDCSLEAKDKNNRNACHWAAMNGNADIVTMLIEISAPENIFGDKDDSSRTPLMYAAENGHHEVIEALIPTVDDTNKKFKNEGSVSGSASNAAENVFMYDDKATIAKPIDIDDSNIENGMTALHYATQKNHENVVNMLVEKGADIDSTNFQGNTPLHIAALANLGNMIMLLLSLGARIDVLNKRDQTPLHSGVEQNKIDAVEVLLLRGASTNGIDTTGKTPLLMAARSGYIAMVDMLIKADRFNKKKQEIEEMINGSSENHKVDPNEEKFLPPDYTNVFNIHLNELINTVLKDPKYRLKEFNQPYADEFKLYLWKLAFTHLRYGEWKKLAQYWGFNSEHILAIECQQVQTNSYKYHGYRVLCIWFHSVEPNETPIRGIYEALVSIGRRKLAHNVRRDLDVRGGKVTINSACVIS